MTACMTAVWYLIVYCVELPCIDFCLEVQYVLVSPSE